MISIHNGLALYKVKGRALSCPPSTFFRRKGYHGWYIYDSSCCGHYMGIRNTLENDDFQVGHYYSADSNADPRFYPGSWVVVGTDLIGRI